MSRDAKQCRLILPASAKARSSAGPSPWKHDEPSPQVLHTVQAHIRFWHHHLQPQDSFLVVEPDIVGHSVDWW
ncbi:hypothetical protein UA08_06755 [Talaromyces atroroseus]|uniref:Uncharacterized protein n=1 Tax=Talaromyces atroroseus TaxID=1441469 RepID=A0A225AXR0_TALAT|nr:hypothetical protein UA08_06755 [Talaromyces atroroseus]OKL58277.1 hypothetical protein UA08_06755 [Talaromyces atroroseus]